MIYAAIINIIIKTKNLLIEKKRIRTQIVNKSHLISKFLYFISFFNDRIKKLSTFFLGKELNEKNRQTIKENKINKQQIYRERERVGRKEKKKN